MHLQNDYKILWLPTSRKLGYQFFLGGMLRVGYYLLFFGMEFYFLLLNFDTARLPNQKDMTAAKMEVIRCIRKWAHLTVQIFQATSSVAKKRHFLKSERLAKDQFFNTTNNLISSIFTCTNHIINLFIIKLLKIIKLRFNQDINSLSTTFSNKFGRYISGA